MVFRDVQADGTTRLTGGGVSSVEEMWPVDSVYISMVDVNPAANFGGVWVKIAAGRTLVGVDPTQAEFDTVGETGGEKEVTLTAAESGNPVTNAVKQQDGGGFYFNVGSDADPTHRATLVGPSAAAESHNNLPPYFTVYFWRRTA